MQNLSGVETKSAKWAFRAFPVAKQDNSICFVQDSKGQNMLCSQLMTQLLTLVFLLGYKDGFENGLYVHATT